MVDGVQRGFDVVDMIGYLSLVFAQMIPHLASDRLGVYLLGALHSCSQIPMCIECSLAGLSFVEAIGAVLASASASAS